METELELPPSMCNGHVHIVSVEKRQKVIEVV